MTVETTSNTTDRQHQFQSVMVGQGVLATQSATVAAALEQVMQDGQALDVSLSVLEQDVWARMEMPRSVCTDQDDAFLCCPPYH